MQNMQELMSLLQKQGPYGVQQETLPKQSWGEFFFGSPERVMRTQKYSQPQQFGMNQLLMQGLQGMDPEANERRARSQFNTETIPSIMERFAGAGQNKLDSSGLRGSLGQASSNLELGLSDQRSQMALKQLMMALMPQFESAFRPATGGLVGGAVQQQGEMMKQMLPMLMMMMAA